MEGVLCGELGIFGIVIEVGLLGEFMVVGVSILGDFVVAGEAVGLGDKLLACGFDGNFGNVVDNDLTGEAVGVRDTSGELITADLFTRDAGKGVILTVGHGSSSSSVRLTMLFADVEAEFFELLLGRGGDIMSSSSSESMMTIAFSCCFFGIDALCIYVFKLRK